ncbi:hypothetical protein [Streptomyces nymphaeiformis]|uniref:Uncharacterized protein n=1 Tax=Streptomyces nymphaeiformis TaxID=2663842 RepID=A0A7W7XD45_9ACTN|nr:hypothetical protein [Streptomyces nymphaeiformis]MBB4984334.1 hypothetical protein [Streptomyces nymphaeiformis]
MDLAGAGPVDGGRAFDLADDAQEAERIDEVVEEGLPEGRRHPYGDASHHCGGRIGRAGTGAVGK